ncbi:Trm112 family protein [Herbaspirillum lusitanum]|uniref:Trm112 family protein n=1 Tax=Herbaspirillum lusitanum TaxID=213312 RepID=UPI0004949C5E|nr:Trm112 family protein [Herbaspirillum lusitanum]MCW5297967.1 Trm112 family protein [Herbaspirillum lusitanum]
MNARLLDILVCPICKGPLEYDKKAQELICNGDKLAYPIRDGIPIMWADEARDLGAAPAGPAAAVEPAAE